MNTSGYDCIARSLGQYFSGPMLFNYVWWLLSQARDRNLKRLYFLARDGYLLHRIALLFCKTFDMKIDCRYLYVSRTALRMPTYHFIGDECWDLLTVGGYQVTPYSLLDRVKLTEEQRFEVYQDCGIAFQDEKQLLSRQDLAEWADALKKSSVYHRFVIEKSQVAYHAAIGYMHQEGLFDKSSFALVDSGWTGSMQRSLRQLLNSAGFDGHLTGFYFGMFAAPKASEDGTYLTWYFDRHSSPFIKAPFCNNLFECLLAAPHGMTTDYELCNGQYVPVLLPAPQAAELAHVESQINAVIQYTEQRLKEIDFDSFPEKDARMETRKLINRYMAHPRREEAIYYGENHFCDDVSEAYKLSLANGSQIKALKGYSIFARAWGRIVKKKQLIPELFWPYGAIAFLPVWRRWWYRMNVYIWEWLRYVLW